MDLPALTQKIFAADKNIRGITFGRFDGGILHFEMRSDIETLNPPGSIGKLDAEVLVPTLVSYFDTHKKYFGEVDYMLTKFEKVSIAYIKCLNIYAIISVEPKISVYPIVKKVQKILFESIKKSV